MFPIVKKKNSPIPYEPFFVTNVTTLSLPFLLSLQVSNVIFVLDGHADGSVWMLRWLWQEGNVAVSWNRQTYPLSTRKIFWFDVIYRTDE